MINRDRCKPPMEDAQVDKIAKSASSSPDPPLWLVDPVRFAEDPKLDGKARHVLATLAARARRVEVVRRRLANATSIHVRRALACGVIEEPKSGKVRSCRWCRR